MPVLTVGNTEIDYTTRLSPKVTRKQIVVTPDSVEIVAPEGAVQSEIEAFLRTKRRWVFDQRERMHELMAQRMGPERYVSGAKIPFRGRLMKLIVREGDVDEAVVRYQGGFEVTVPRGLKQSTREASVEDAVNHWLHDRILRDAQHVARQYCRTSGLIPKAVRVKEQKHLWGSCGRDQIININRRLIAAPKPVLEYVVVHELCHLKYRDHSPAFWKLLRGIMPDFESRKEWLDQERVWFGTVAVSSRIWRVI